MPLISGLIFILLIIPSSSLDNMANAQSYEKQSLNPNLGETAPAIQDIEREKAGEKAFENCFLAIKPTKTVVTASSITVASGNTVTILSNADACSVPISNFGKITLNDNAAGGTFNPAPSCSDPSNCQVTYTAPHSSIPTTVTITATYAGLGYISSYGTTQLSVTPQPVSTNKCNPITGNFVDPQIKNQGAISSPDGRSQFTASNNSLKTSSGTSATLYPASTNYQYSWSPNSKYLLLVSQTSSSSITLQTYDTSTGSKTLEIPVTYELSGANDPTEIASCPCNSGGKDVSWGFSPDDKTFVVAYTPTGNTQGGFIVDLYKSSTIGGTVLHYGNSGQTLYYSDARWQFSPDSNLFMLALNTPLPGYSLPSQVLFYYTASTTTPGTQYLQNGASSISLVQGANIDSSTSSFAQIQNIQKNPGTTQQCTGYCIVLQGATPSQIPYPPSCTIAVPEFGPVVGIVVLTSIIGVVVITRRFHF